MKETNPSASAVERCVLGVLDAGVLAALVAWMVDSNYFQSVFIAAALALALLTVLSLAAWRHGFRWFLTRPALRFYGWLSAGIVSVIVLFYAEEAWRGKRAWVALQREAAARGESLELSSVAPPPVPDAENFALAPGVPTLLGYAELAPGAADSGSEQLAFYPDRHEQWPAASWALQQTTDLAGWQEFFREHPLANALSVAAKPSTPAADVLLALSRYDAGLALLRTANQRPKLRYPLAYEKGLFALISPHPARVLHGQFEAGSLQAAVQILSLRAVAELAQDQNEAALQDTLLALRLADSLGQQPYEHLHRFRKGMLLRCLQPVWEGLASHRWNEAQLLALQQGFEGLDLLAEFRLAGRGNTLVMMNMADQFQAFLQGRHSPMSDHFASAQENIGWITTLCRLFYPVGWLYQDKVWMYRFYEQRADVFKVLDQENRRLRGSELRRATDPFLLIMVAPKISEIFQEQAPTALFLQTACQEAAVACALERYRLTQGKYPAALEALVPLWLKQVPADLLDHKGGKLRYRPGADGGFVLYSVGVNRVDDEGKPASPEKDWRRAQAHWRRTKADFPNLHEGDWVWSQPGR